MTPSPPSKSAPPSGDPSDDGELEELLREVRRIEVQSRRLVADMMAGGYASVFRGAGMEFQEVREYEEGDDPRSVDWNVTARMGRPFIKKYKDERDLSVVFLVDLSPSMHAGCGAWTPRQMAARIAACLALTAARSGDKVGMVGFGSHGVVQHVPLRPGYPHALRIVRDCLAFQGQEARGSQEDGISAALQHLGRVVRGRAVVFLLSDFADPCWRGDADSAPLIRRLTRASRRHDVTAVHLLSPERIPDQPHHHGPSFFDHLVQHRVRMTRMADPETGAHRTLDWGDTGQRQAWAQLQEAARAHTRDLLQRSAVSVMDAPIPLAADADAVTRPVVNFFRMRHAKGSHR